MPKNQALSELSPSERYRKAKASRKDSELSKFTEGLKFPLDPFQEESCRALERGSGVLVAAPTGAGKTIVGEFAIHLAVSSGQKVFYTTPIKALSNQKFQELTKRYGKERVGLLTGDTNNNSEAQIVVMTTEVLRNMIYATSTSLRDLGYVVMDEVHYLADRFRGAVWEEVILHLPKDVKVVSLSATVSNAEEFGAWLAEVRGNTEIIVSEHRPVPLHQHVLLGDELLELFDPSSKQLHVNPELARKHHARSRGPIKSSGKWGGGSFKSDPRNRNQLNFPKLDKPEVVEMLAEGELLPVIFFIFSRAGCEKAVEACRRAGLRLTSREEQLQIRAIVDERCGSIADEDLDTLGYFDWLASLERGYAAHHAGMLPAFKEVVEELFLKKLVKAVFATETLALGINMPARTVVLERLDKFNGESRVSVTPGEYTQLTGRAGRRGIDTEGHSVILWGAQLDPNLVAGLASKRLYPLNSSFKPTYNMAINLTAAFGASRASAVLEKSFAQFQADRSVVGLARTISEKQESLEGYEESMQCHLGDFVEYSAMRRELSDLERAGTQERGRAGKDMRQSKSIRRLDSEIAELKKRMRAHPSHGCADRESHARWGERYQKLRKEIDAAVTQIESRTNQVAKTFQRICQLLTDLDYMREVDDDLEVTSSGDLLAKIYGERDLLIAQCINRGVWKNLDAASMAAMGMALVYEGRRDEGDYEPKLPKGAFIAALEQTEEIQQELLELQTKYRLPKETALELGACWAFYRWASGGRLDDVLKLSGLLPGDFIRWAKQLIDFLDQVAKAGDPELKVLAQAATDQVKRGIVAYSFYI